MQHSWQLDSSQEQKEVSCFYAPGLCVMHVEKSMWPVSGKMCKSHMLSENKSQRAGAAPDLQCSGAQDARSLIFGHVSGGDAWSVTWLCRLLKDLHPLFTLRQTLVCLLLALIEGLHAERLNISPCRIISVILQIGHAVYFCQTESHHRITSIFQNP